MATPGFQLYTDKENVSSLRSIKNARGRHGIAPVAKIFGASKSFQTPVRKALGDMNRDVATPTFTPKQKIFLGHLATPTCTPKQKNFLTQFKKPDLKGTVPTPIPIKLQPQSARPVNVLLQQEQILKVHKSKGPSTGIVKAVPKRIDSVSDDIERGYIYQDEPDDFEDIFPKKDRPSSYLDAIISWRPPCLRPEIDEEKEEEERRREMFERFQEDSRNVIEYPESIVDDDLPPIEMLPYPDSDIPLPSLDESLDIMQHIGSLTLKED